MKKKTSSCIWILSCLLWASVAQAGTRDGVATHAFPIFGSAPQGSARGTRASSVSAYKLIALKVTGSQRYTEKEILPASGLEIGQNAGEGDFKEAIQRLGETGMFSDIAYSFSYSGAGTRLEFQLADVASDKLVPAKFENFVWFTDTELLAELQKRVPLFKGVLPTGGTLTDKVSESLQAILSEKQLPGRVDYMREGNTDGGNLTDIDFKVAEVDIRIEKLEFPGASPALDKVLSDIGEKLMDADYLRSSLAVVARLDFLPVYLQRGYLKASFAPSEARVISQSGAQVNVDAVLAVTPGKVYSVSGVAWQGNAAIGTQELQAMIHLPIGEPADAVRLAEDLDKVAKAYRSHGYMEARVTPAPQFDDQKATVHYDLNVAEGAQFKMGDLELVGLDSQSRDRMREAWTLRPGETYNAEYPRKYLDDNFHLLPGSEHWSAKVHEAINTTDKTVDVTIRFSPR